ncbi:ATP-dependent RNA helicase [Pseudoscourfieldia marina]
MAAAAAASPVNSMASVCRAHLASCDVVVMANAPWAAAAASPQDNNDAMATLATLIAANFGGTCIVACDTDARAWALSSLHDTPSAAAAGTGVGGLDGRVSCRVIERSSASFFTSPSPSPTPPTAAVSSKCECAFTTHEVLASLLTTDPMLKDVKAVVVDVDATSADANASNGTMSPNAALVLALMRKLLASRAKATAGTAPLKLVVATADDPARAAPLARYLAGASSTGGGGFGRGGHGGIGALSHAVMCAANPDAAFGADPPSFYLREPAADYVNAAVDATRRLHATSATGDILVFLPRDEDCEQARVLCDASGDHSLAASAWTCSNCAASSLPAPPSSAVYTSSDARSKQPTRHVIFAAVPSASMVRARRFERLTRVRFVVDACLSRRLTAMPRRGISSIIDGVAAASALEMRRRAALVPPGGAVYRLCTLSAALPLARAEVTADADADAVGVDGDFAAPLLRLLSLGVTRLASIPFPPGASPHPDAVAEALEELRLLGAIDDQARLTPDVGVPLAELVPPLSVPMARALIASVENDCVEEVLAIACVYAELMRGGTAGMATNTFWTPLPRRAGREARAERMRRRGKFAAAEGAFLTALNVFAAFDRIGASRGGGGGDKVNSRAQAAFCEVHGIRTDVFRRASLARAPLRRRLKALVNFAPPTGGNSATPLASGVGAPVRKVQRSLAAGFLGSAATIVERVSDGGGGARSLYRTVRGGVEAYLPAQEGVEEDANPTPPACVVCRAVFCGGDDAAKLVDAVAIDAAWLEELGGYRL